MTVTPATFKIRFPEFASEDDARVQLFIDDAICEVNAEVWGVKTDIGVSYLAAHFLSVANLAADSGGSGFSGAISSKSVDGTSVTFGQTAADNQEQAFYSSTSYGQRYLALRQQLGGAMYVA